MKKLPLKVLFLCLLAVPALLSCASAKLAKARTSCPSDLFIEATGTGKTPGEASDKAKVEIGRKIISQVKSQTKIDESSKETEGVFRDTSIYSVLNEINSSSTLYGFKEMEVPKPLENGEYELRGYVCNSDAAKPYLDSLRNYRDLLKALKRHNLDKNICGRASEARKNMRGFETILEVLRQTDKSLQKEYEDIYGEIENDCGLEAGKKLHWNPEKQSAYSDLAFSKLSASLQMETSPCKGKGISLVYSGEEKCIGTYLGIECSLNPSLSIQSCGGEKYSMLKIREPVIGTIADNKNKAKENLLENFSKSDFFSEWETKIMEAMPECSK